MIRVLTQISNLLATISVKGQDCYTMVTVQNLIQELIKQLQQEAEKPEKGK